MNKNSLFWIILGVLVLLVVFVVFFVEYQEDFWEDFEGNYTYVGLDNATFEFEAKLKEGTNVIFHYVTLDRYDNKKKVHDYFTVVLRNSPYEVEDIPMEDVKEHMYDWIYTKDYTYIVQDPFLADQTDQGSVTASYQLGLNIGIAGLLKTNTYLRYNVDGYSDNPSYDCSYVDENSAVIEYRLGEIGIYSEDGCIILQGNNKEEIYEVTDKFVMHLGEIF